MWKTLDFNPLYEANELGEVRKISNYYYPCIGHDKDGYATITLSGKKYFLHRVIALTFIPNPNNKPEVNHINSIRDDNRVENLEWFTRSENEKHAYRDGRWEENRRQARENLLTYAVSAIKKRVIQLDLNGDYVQQFESLSEAERQTGINHRNISLVCSHRRKTAGGFKWKYFEEWGSTTSRKTQDASAPEMPNLSNIESEDIV